MSQKAPRIAEPTPPRGERTGAVDPDALVDETDLERFAQQRLLTLEDERRVRNTRTIAATLWGTTAVLFVVMLGFGVEPRVLAVAPVALVAFGVLHWLAKKRPSWVGVSLVAVYCGIITLGTVINAQLRQGPYWLSFGVLLAAATLPVRGVAAAAIGMLGCFLVMGVLTIGVPQQSQEALPTLVYAGALAATATAIAILQGVTARRSLREAVVREVRALAAEESSRRSVAQRERLSQELRQAQKLEALGRLAGGVAHDLNNVMTAVLGYAELTEIKAIDEQTRSNARAIQDSAQRAAALTRQLLAFARKQPHSPKVLDVDSLVIGLERLLLKLVPGGVSLIILADADRAAIRADPNQIEQVVMNLVVNARDALDGKGTIAIDTRRAAPGSVPEHGENADYVCIEVTDDGAGMSPDVLEHIFEPFFTMKQAGVGTGLGLATCYGIVEQSGGHIAVWSEPGKGSRFTVYLPRVDAEPGADKEKSVAPPSGGTETVLLVEDEPRVRAFVHRALTDAGYRVIEAVDGAQGLELGSSDARIDVVVTDIVMPRLGGVELAAALRARNRALPVVFMSGYSEEPPPAAAGSMLAKPFKRLDLLRMVRAALDDAPRPVEGVADGAER